MNSFTTQNIHALCKYHNSADVVTYSIKSVYSITFSKRFNSGILSVTEHLNINLKMKLKDVFFYFTPLFKHKKGKI